MVIKKATVKTLKLLIINPVFTAAVFCAILFYTGTVKLKDRHSFVCLFNLSDISEIEGNISSSPVKSSTKDYYTFDFQVKKAWKNYCSTSCNGTIKVLIAAESVEKNLPGKLYSSTLNSIQNKSLYETGARFRLKGSFSVSEQNNSFLFLTTQAQASGFDKSIKGKILHFRSLCRLQFKRLMYGWGQAGGLLLALLSGSREYTDSTMAEAFKNAGLSHVLALSGMHLSLFGGIAFFFGSRLTRKNMADLFELTAIIFFVWFAGLSPSLFRALLSSIIVFINSSLRMRRFKGLTVLSATFLLHLMIFPQHLNSAAFMLSYGALAGIMTLGQLIKYLLGKRIIPFVNEKISESAGAQLFTSPVSFMLFGKIMPIGIISSVLVSPMVILFLYAGLAGTVLCLILPFLAPAFNGIINYIYTIIEITVKTFARVPALSI